MFFPIVFDDSHLKKNARSNNPQGLPKYMHLLLSKFLFALLNYENFFSHVNFHFIKVSFEFFFSFVEIAAIFQFQSAQESGFIPTF